MKILSLLLLVLIISLTGCKKVHNVTLQAKVINLSATTTLNCYVQDHIGDGILQISDLGADELINFAASSGEKLKIVTDFQNKGQGFIQGTITISEGSKQLITINAISETQTFSVPQ